MAGFAIGQKRREGEGEERGIGQTTGWSRVCSGWFSFGLWGLDLWRGLASEELERIQSSAEKPRRPLD